MSQPLIMSFRPNAAAMCLDRRKSMTRRIFKPTMSLTSFEGGLKASVQDNRNGRVIWQVGETVAIKPKRTAKAVGRVLVTGLHVENVQDITEEDAKREGMTFIDHGFGDYGFSDGISVDRHGDRRLFATARDAFEAVWKRLYPSGPNSWDANPWVVVIEFEPVKKEEDL